MSFFTEKTQTFPSMQIRHFWNIGLVQWMCCCDCRWKAGSKQLFVYKCLGQYPGVSRTPASSWADEVPGCHSDGTTLYSRSNHHLTRVLLLCPLQPTTQSWMHIVSRTEFFAGVFVALPDLQILKSCCYQQVQLILSEFPHVSSIVKLQITHLGRHSRSVCPRNLPSYTAHYHSRVWAQ